MSRQELELVPHPRLYEFMISASDHTLSIMGGYSAHNPEKLRAVEGQAAIVAPNHRANIDSFALGLSLYNLPKYTADFEEGALESRPVHFMAKDSLWKLPIIKTVVSGCGAFPVERNKGLGLQPAQVDHVAKLVSHKALMCIYPEGTRYPKDVDQVHRSKLKTTIAFLALKHGVPIVPVGIAGPKSIAKLPREVVFGDPIRVPAHQNVDSADFKVEKLELMDELHSQIEANYQQARTLAQTR